MTDAQLLRVTEVRCPDHGVLYDAGAAMDIIAPCTPDEVRVLVDTALCHVCRTYDFPQPSLLWATEPVEES